MDNPVKKNLTLIFSLLVAYIFIINVFVNSQVFPSLSPVITYGISLTILASLAYLLFYVQKTYEEKNRLNHLLTNILDTTTNGIQFIDKEGRTQILNPAAESLYNRPKEETLGRFDWELFYDGRKFDAEGNYNSLITETLETGKSYKDQEKELLNKEGHSKVYLVETFRLYDTDGEVLGAMGVYKDITEKKLVERQLLDAHYEVARMSVTDHLTSLYNVRYFHQRLNEEVGKAYKSSLSLMLIDVDYFKKYNDLYGHPAGDRLLKQLAQLIKSSVRTSDIVARYGGEEFAVILPGMKKEHCREVAERLRENVRDFNFFGKEKLPGGRLTVTIGIASIPEDCQTGEELIRIADNALYRGKYRNRDMVVAE